MGVLLSLGNTVEEERIPWGKVGGILRKMMVLQHWTKWAKRTECTPSTETPFTTVLPLYPGVISGPEQFSWQKFLIAFNSHQRYQVNPCSGAKLPQTGVGTELPGPL